MKIIRKILPVILIFTLVLATANCALAGLGGRRYITTGSAYMRAEPNKDSKKVNTLPKDTVIDPTNAETDSRGVTWYYAKYHKNWGWVSEKNLKVYKGKPTPKPTAKPINYSKFKDVDGSVKVTASSLNMRKEPSSDYAVLAAYPQGAVLEALAFDGSWYKVFDAETNRTGYMSAKYLEKYEAPAPAEAADTEWVEIPVGESGFTIEIPDGMVEQELDPECTDWDERNITVYNARCQDLDVKIGKFEGVATMDEVKAIMTELGTFESVELNANGVLECLGGDDEVLVAVVGDEEAGFYCLTISPLEKDPDAEEYDNTVGVEMADKVFASLKLA